MNTFMSRKYITKETQLIPREYSHCVNFSWYLLKCHPYNTSTMKQWPT